MDREKEGEDVRVTYSSEKEAFAFKAGELEQFLGETSQSAKLQGCAFENNCWGLGVGETVLLMIESQEEKIPNY